MKVITCSDKVIYRAGRGKKVKFVTDKSKFAEIVVSLEDKREVEEVDE